MGSRSLLRLATVLLTLLPLNAARAYELHLTADGSPTHWAQERVVFRLSPAARASLGQESLARAIVMATEAWRGLPGSPDLVFGAGGGAGLLEPDATDGINGIYISASPLEGDHLAETRLSFEPATGRIVDVDIVISETQPWAVMTEGGSPVNVYDLGAVLTHEMGHALGLSDEPAQAQATMFPRFARGDTRARTPEVDDERGVLAAYRRHPVDALGAAGCSTGGSSVPPLGATLVLLMLMLRSRQRPLRAHAQG